jgi:putative flavoprotein involved in K+ transport
MLAGGRGAAMRRTDVVVIGGGQAGLAMSACLSARGLDHVVLERGRVGERWRSERWDSLRLLTPNWQSRLPGWSYRGPDPDGYMTSRQVARHLDAYARAIAAPVHAGTTVRRVDRALGGYRVVTDGGKWWAPSVVIATGMCDVPHVPPFAGALAVHQLVPTAYRRPGDLPAGGVLVVGASATGVQLADELQRSGRPTTLAVGRHVRLPRTYRGRDIMAWLDEAGILDERIEDAPDPERARRQPSFQLVGRADRATLDLPALAAAGVRLVGRVVGATGGRVELAGDLADTTRAADARLARLLDRIDAFAGGRGERPAPFVAGAAPAELDLAAEGITTVLWCTGYRRSYPWLAVPVLDDRGEIRHDRGITPAPGLVVLGLQFMRRRKSSFIDGVGADAEELADHLAARLRQPMAA